MIRRPAGGKRAALAATRMEAANRAQQVYDLYGSACVQAEWIGIYMHRKAPADRELLGKMVLATEAKIALFADEARARRDQPAPVETADLSDEIVVDAIRTLTALDSDHAEKANDLGWSKKTTLGGHWCCQMLDTDRPLAIAEGRRLIAHHLVQLKKLGVIRRAAA